MNRKLLIITWLLLTLFISGCLSLGLTAQTMAIVDDTTIKDSMGRTIDLSKPYEKVVSLYSAHTENAYIIGGAGNQVIGVNSASTYPPDVTELPILDYRGDPEPIIALNPDLVLTRPNTERNYSDYIRAIEKAGIQVMALYPDDETSFDTYIQILGKVFGKEDKAKLALESYHKRLSDIESISMTLDPDLRVSVFF